jgi:hypothetical protein
MDIRAIATKGLWTTPSGGAAIVAPTVISATRSGNSGSAVIQGTAGNTIECCAVHPIDKTCYSLGSIVATGGLDTMPLNFSHFTSTIFALTLNVAAVNLEFTATDGTNFSDTTDYPFTDLLVTNSLTITNYVRGLNTAEFDVAGMPTNLNFAALLYADYDGWITVENIVPGHNIITGLHPMAWWRLIGLLAQNTTDGTMYLYDTEVGDLLTALPTPAIIDSINVLIYQLIKNDTDFQALTNASPADPRIYLEYPPEQIRMDTNHPGYATYTMEGGGEIGRDRTFLTQMPDRKYRIDVYARTKGDCDAIYKAIERVLVYKYYQQTTEERVKAIRPLSPGIPQFLADVRLYHASGLFSVEGIQRLNYT